MRDPEEYKAAGRNDPTTAQQLEEHPYDFVDLPPAPAELAAPTHDRLDGDRLHGVLHLTYLVETPLHVGSGSFDTSEDHGFPGRSTPLRGLVRRRGKPVLPGSSWKGVVRSRFEAFTRSHLCQVRTKVDEQAWKLPEVLRKESGVMAERKGSKVGVEIQDPKVTRLKPSGMIRSADDLARLSPADALFGGMGYRGRVRPMEGEFEGEPAAGLLVVPPLEGPQMHRLAKPGKIAAVPYGSTPKPLLISQVEGRKFYYDGPLISENQHGRCEPIDQVPAGSTLRLTVHFTNLTQAELGALLLAAGHGEGVGVVRFGGYKSAGLGKVRLLQAEVLCREAQAVRRWRQPVAEPLDLATLLDAARAAPWFDAEALRQLDAVTRRQRPAPGGGR